MRGGESEGSKRGEEWEEVRVNIKEKRRGMKRVKVRVGKWMK